MAKKKLCNKDNTVNVRKTLIKDHVGCGTEGSFATWSKIVPDCSFSMSMPSLRASSRNFWIIYQGSNIDSSGSQLDSDKLYLNC